MNRLRRRSSIYDNLHDLPEESENTGKMSHENIMDQFDSMMEMLNEVRNSFEQEDTLRRTKKSSSTPPTAQNLENFINQNYSDEEEDDDLPPLIIPSEGNFFKDKNKFCIFEITNHFSIIVFLYGLMFLSFIYLSKILVNLS